MPMRDQTPMPLYQYSYGLWRKVLLKQTCQSIGDLINRYFEEVRLLTAFYHDFKNFVQFSVNLAEYFLQSSSF